MNWDMVSAIGEILGSVAVLVTLAYLALQARQTNVAIQANTRQALVGLDQAFLFRVMDDPELAQLRYKPGLTENEKIRLSMYLAAFFRMRELLYRQYQEGVLDKPTWQSYRNSIAAFASPNVRAWVHDEMIGRMFDPDFMSMARDIIDKAPDSSRTMWSSVYD
jgi:hypothetical protein